MSLMHYGLEPINFNNPAAAAGKADTGFSRRGAKMRGHINKGGSGSEIVVFPNVDHGFNADYRPSYDKAAAHYAQKLAGDWFKKHRV